MSEEIDRLRAFAAEYQKITGEPAEPILRKIARLEAAAADPWREAKAYFDSYRKYQSLSQDARKAIDHYYHLTAENARLEKRVKELERHVAALVQAGNLYRQASFQSHSGHWDSTMQHGKGCPECIRANELRKQADEMMDQEKCPEPTESIEPILDPARVLATAAVIYGKRGLPLSEGMCRKDSKGAKPYRLKGADE